MLPNVGKTTTDFFQQEWCDPFYFTRHLPRQKDLRILMEPALTCGFTAGSGSRMNALNISQTRDSRLFQAEGGRYSPESRDLTSLNLEMCNLYRWNFRWSLSKASILGSLDTVVKNRSHFPEFVRSDRCRKQKISPKYKENTRFAFSSTFMKSTE